jgi:hypothetical protein
MAPTEFVPLPHANDELSGGILGERTTHGRNTTTMPDDANNVQMALPGTYMNHVFFYRSLLTIFNYSTY